MGVGGWVCESHEYVIRRQAAYEINVYCQFQRTTLSMSLWFVTGNCDNDMVWIGFCGLMWCGVVCGTWYEEYGVWYIVFGIPDTTYDTLEWYGTRYVLKFDCCSKQSRDAPPLTPHTHRKEKYNMTKVILQTSVQVVGGFGRRELWTDHWNYTNVANISKLSYPNPIACCCFFVIMLWSTTFLIITSHPT